MCRIPPRCSPCFRRGKSEVGARQNTPLALHLLAPTAPGVVLRQHDIQNNSQKGRNGQTWDAVIVNRNANAHRRHADADDSRTAENHCVSPIRHVDLVVNEHFQRVARDKAEYDDRNSPDNRIGNRSHERTHLRAETAHEKRQLTSCGSISGHLVTIPYQIIKHIPTSALLEA